MTGDPHAKQTDRAAFFSNAHDMALKDVNMIGSLQVSVQNGRSDDSESYL